MNWFVLAALFFLLSPGVILTLPPVGHGVLFSGRTSVPAAIVHSLVFVLVVYYLQGYVPSLLEGFLTCPTGKTKRTNTKTGQQSCV